MRMRREVSRVWLFAVALLVVSLVGLGQPAAGGTGGNPSRPPDTYVTDWDAVGTQAFTAAALSPEPRLDRPVPTQRTAPAARPPLGPRLQRGQGHRVGRQHDPHRRADHRRPVLGRGPRPQRINFTVPSLTGLGDRFYERPRDLENDVGNARIWGGIHFRTAVEDAIVMARKVTNQVLDHHFQPVND
jgi:hypothetical protein